MMKRLFDIILSFLSLLIFFIPSLVISLLIKLTDPGPSLYWSKRIGKDNQIFLMPKFRTMKTKTPTVATHLLDASSFLTPIGALLRQLSLDEIPQVWSILKGDMSIVGPRPALYNQNDLISLRTKYDIHKLKPGLTGWAQINGRDEISISRKVELDNYYLNNKSFSLDIKILCLTFFKVLLRKDVSH